VLDNARVLWSRFVERNRRDVEERAEQLKSIGNIAALVAGFAVVAFLEFQAEWSKLNTTLAAAFGLSTALVVSVSRVYEHAVKFPIPSFCCKSGKSQP
jgi:calcium release-activated calcium channel protein 1